MRVAEAAGLELVDVDVKPCLVRIAVKNGLIRRGLVGRVSPLELIGRHIGDGRRIKLDRAARTDKAQTCRRNREREVNQSATIGQFCLPCLGFGADRWRLDRSRLEATVARLQVWQKTKLAAAPFSSMGALVFAGMVLGGWPGDLASRHPSRRWDISTFSLRSTEALGGRYHARSRAQATTAGSNRPPPFHRFRRGNAAGGRSRQHIRFCSGWPAP